MHVYDALLKQLRLGRFENPHRFEVWSMSTVITIGRRIIVS